MVRKMAIYSYKFRLYPNREQENLIQRTFGCCRFVYNHFLDERKRSYDETGKSPTRFQQDKSLTGLKQELEWLREVDSQALKSSLRNLDCAYKNFFRRKKQEIKPYGYPQFKTKKSNRKSYTSRGSIRMVDGKHVQLPKLGYVKCAVSKEVQGRILSATVSQNPSGKYFVALCCTEVDIQPLPKTGAVVGVDFGIKKLVTTSDGKKYENHKYISKAEKQLARLQRSLSRKSKGSNNRNKARIKVARLNEKIANQRKDHLHKITIELLKKYDFICINDLNVKDMLQDNKFAKYVADASFGELRRQLEYKADLYGKNVSIIDRFYPSSQLCSCCGCQNEKIKDLSVRKWVCPQCGAEHDRDVNAAKNILNEGLRLLA